MAASINRCGNTLLWISSAGIWNAKIDFFFEKSNSLFLGSMIPPPVRSHPLDEDCYRPPFAFAIRPFSVLRSAEASGLATNPPNLQTPQTSPQGAARPSATPQMVAECATSGTEVPEWARDRMNQLHRNINIRNWIPAYL